MAPRTARGLCAVPFLMLACCPAAVGAEAEAVSAPKVEIQVIAAQDDVERGQEVELLLLVRNRSAVLLENPRLALASAAFQLSQPPDLPAAIGPFAGFQRAAKAKALDGASFAKHRLPFTFEYSWELSGSDVHAVEAATLEIAVTRRFEEEAKIFPGGTAALLYLLLPILPALLSFQVVNGLRQGKGLQAPELKTAHLVPAALLAIVLNILILTVARSSQGIDYANPLIFVGVLLASAFLGALFPALLWARAVWRGRKWNLSSADTPAAYLEKVLLGPGASTRFNWVKVQVGAQVWEGLRLRQPSGAEFLGVQLQVIPTPGGGMTFDRLTQELLSPDGTIQDSEKLVEMVKEGSLSLAPLQQVRKGSEGQKNVAIKLPAKFVERDAKAIPLLVAVR